MAGVYRTEIEFGAMPDSLVIHCSDPRYQPHFHEFLSKYTGLREYALMALPGGPHCLALEDQAPELAGCGWQWMRFLAELMRPRRVILIAHDDCRWYQQPQFAALGDAGREHLAGDLRHVRTLLNQRVADTEVEIYYARRDYSNVTFEAL